MERRGFSVSPLLRLIHGLDGIATDYGQNRIVTEEDLAQHLQRNEERAHYHQLCCTLQDYP